MNGTIELVGEKVRLRPTLPEHAPAMELVVDPR